MGASAGLLALLGTLLVALVPALQFAYRAPTLHVVLETAAALVALCVGYLLYGRFRAHGRLRDLLLCYALGVVAVANLVLTALPAAVLSVTGRELTGWAPLVVRLLGTVLLAAAALIPSSVHVRRTRAARIAWLLAAAVLALAALGYVLGEQLPPPVDPRLVLDPSRLLVAGHPLVLAAQVLGVLLYSAAAVAFARQASRDSDEFLRWLAPACALAAVARLNYLLVPSLYSDYVYTGDLLRLGFYVLLLVGAAREVRRYWETQAEAAVLEDRRRMARDLHDGLTQELCFIRAQAQRLGRQPAPDPVTVERIGGAAMRALDEARGAIAALTRTSGDAATDMLRQCVEDLADRYEIRVTTEIEPGVTLTVPQAEALLRISAEAIRNAVHHGGATAVEVRLEGCPLRLLVRDNGCGFDPGGSHRAGAFGLTSMRERAEHAGAVLDVVSEPLAGTDVRVEWA